MNLFLKIKCVQEKKVISDFLESESVCRNLPVISLCRQQKVLYERFCPTIVLRVMHSACSLKYFKFILYCVHN